MTQPVFDEADLTIATERMNGLNMGEAPSDAAIIWWEVRGKERTQPARPCHLNSPAVAARLRYYELAETARIGKWMVRYYRKLSLDRVAHQLGASHRAVNGNYPGVYYRPTYMGGPIEEIVITEREIGEWKRSRHSLIPDWTVVL